MDMPKEGIYEKEAEEKEEPTIIFIFLSDDKHATVILYYPVVVTAGGTNTSLALCGRCLCFLECTLGDTAGHA